MELNIPPLVYVVLQFIAFLFVLVATPLDMFRFRVNFFNTAACLTLWGMKLNCSDVSHTTTVYRVWDECPDHLRLFRAAEALAIVSILVYGAAFVLGVVMLFCCPLLRWICLTLNIAGAITLCFVWAAMVVTFLRDGEDCPTIQRFTQYGVGFALFVVAWVLDVVNIVFLLLPFHITVFRELDGSNENSDEKSKERSTERSSQEEEEE